MADQQTVDLWVDEFVRRLRTQFGSRLMYVDLHGSWARGEGRPDSDIDMTVVLDHIEDEDLKAYADLVHSMPEARPLASGFLASAKELRAWPRYDRALSRHGRKVLHGSLDGAWAKPTDEDLLGDVRIKAAVNLHVARHYMLYPHDRTAVVHLLRYPFKECFFAMQSWTLLTTGTYYPRKIDLIAVLTDPDDRDLVRVAKDGQDLSEDRTQRPMYYISLLERWCRTMLGRIAAHEGKGRE